MKRISLLLSLLIVHSLQAENTDNVQVTVYQNGLAYVKEQRLVDLPKGEGELRFTNVPKTLIAQSVYLHGDGVTVLEQSYEKDVISKQRLLDAFVGKELELLQTNEYQDREVLIPARLLSTQGDGIYEIDGRIYVGATGVPVLPSAPEGMLLAPALVWLIDSSSARERELELSYLTHGMGWNADYVVVVDKSEQRAALQAWATVENQTGVDFRGASVNLVAGSVHQTTQPMVGLQRKADIAMAYAAPEAAQESFAGYHLFSVDRQTQLMDRTSKQLRLFDAQDVEVDKLYRVYGSQHTFVRQQSGEPERPPVEMVLSLKNTTEHPFPAGTARIYQPDGSGELHFTGEDSLRHTPENETVELKMGQSFDLVAQRLQTDYVQQSTRLHESEWKVTLRNQSQKDAVVFLLETLHGNWEVVSASARYSKESANTLRFDVPVRAGEEAVITYRVKVGL